MVAADPVSNEGDAGRPLSASNLALRIVSAIVLAPLALLAAYLGGWPFALFWAAVRSRCYGNGSHWSQAPHTGLMYFVVRRRYRNGRVGRVAGRPTTALLMVGLGALAAAIFAPAERRLWVTLGVGYAGTLLLAPMFLRGDDAMAWS